MAVLRLLEASLLTPLGPFPFMPDPMFASPSSDELTSIDCSSSSLELPLFNSASLIALLSQDTVPVKKKGLHHYSHWHYEHE